MPRSKKDTVRIIDTKPEVIGGGTLQTQALTIAPPPTGEVAAPSNLTATASGVARSPVKPEAYVDVTWRAPLGTVPTYYDIEYGRSSEWNNTTKTFSNPQRVQSYNLAATLSLGLNTAYRIRVRSVYRNTTSAWTDTVQVTTADDTTPASAVTNVATNWNPITGDLTITWTNPTDPQFRDARVRIYKDATKAELYRTALSINGQYVYTYAQNLEDSSVGDPNLYLVIDTRNWSSSGTVYSTTVELATALAAPTGTPNATTDPDGITGSILWRWPAVSGATSYILNIDGKTRRVFTLEYEYPLSQNLIEHGGVIEEALKLIDNNSNILTDGTNQLTTNSNSSLGWSLVALDIFNQQSPVQAGVVTFTAPGNVSINSVTTNGATGEAIWKWTAVPDCIGYRLTINNTTRNVFGTEFTYPLAQNIQENTTANPLLVYSLVAYNAVNLISQTSASGTATFARPSNITGANVTLNPVTGEAVWRWNAIASGITNYRITITSASTVVRNVFTNEYRYSLAQNIIDNGGSTPLTAIPYSIVAVDALNQVSVTAVTGTATFTAPATPSGLTASFNTPDCSFNWTAGSDVTGYRLTIDGTTRDLGFVNSYTYTLAQNASEHSNNPDPELAYILTAYNAVNQSSSTASATITSPLPNAPTAVTLTAFFNVLVANVTAHVRLPTHRRYKFVFRKNTSTIVDTFYSPENTASLEIDQDGIYDVVVSAEDVFGRSSGTLTSTAVTPDVLTLEELRADAIYSDSVSTSPATLNVLKDNDTITGGVNYLSGATWKWTQFERPLLDRYRTCTAGLFNPTTDTQIYFSTSIDGSTWQWWAGLNVEEELLSVADETTARTNAITIGTTYALKTRWDLSSIVEARFIRIHHRNTVANYTIREFYPRRLVQSDDIEAESILAINIAAGTITGRNISSSARIVAGTGNNVGVLDGTGTWRIYAGNNDPTLAPFKVSQAGALTATGANITGSITITGGNAATIGQRITGLTGFIVPGVILTDGTNALLDDDSRYITDTSITTTVSWYNLVLFTADGNSYTITNGSASVTQRTYLTWTAGGTTLTAVTTPPTASSSVLVATVEPGAVALNIQAPAGATYISGEWINTGSITARNISANTITANEIATGTITADKIAAGAITATKINVQDLSAISANLGTITAGTINGININGTTITGSTIRTSTNSTRVQIDTIGMEVFSLGNKVFELSTSTSGSIRFFGSDPTFPQDITWWASESMINPLGSIIGYESIVGSRQTLGIVGYTDLLLDAGIYGPDGIIRLQTDISWDTGNILLQPDVGSSNRRVGIGTNSPSHLLDVNGVIRGSSYRVGNNQVVSARIGTWGTPGGTLTRGTIAPDVAAAPTAAQFNALAQNVRALITDLRVHGLIGN